MQRLNAIFSFIENRFGYNGKYFDLETMASSKQLLDDNQAKQVDPVLSRQICTAIANYKIPISTYRIDKTTEIDEIFRRINSFGRILSDQEIRQAGVTGAFADLVRTLSTSIRGDVSHDDILVLSKMDAISITNKELNYGISAESIIWVRQGILTKDDIRESKDEEVLADLIAYIASPSDEKPSSSRQSRDNFYGRPEDSSPEEQSRAVQRKLAMDSLVTKYGVVTIEKTISTAFDVFEKVFNSDLAFKKILKKVSPRYGTPRYFQAVILALYDLLFIERLKLADIVGLRKALDGLDSHVDISTGGNWAATNRIKNINVVKGIARDYFKANPDDPVAQIGRTEFINLLAKSRTEAGSYDFKQGFHRLDDKRGFDNESFNSVIATICAMANLGKGKVGYVILGVADKKADAERIRKLDNRSLSRSGEYYVVGVDREAEKFHINMDKYMQLITEKIAQSSLSEEIKIRVTSQISSIEYDSRSVIAIRVEAGSEPCFVGDKLYRRQGAQTVEVPTKEILQIVKLF